MPEQQHSTSEQDDHAPPPTRITLQEITSCSRTQQQKVLEIRNQESVRRGMYTDHEITIEEHLAWLSRLAGTNQHEVYAVLNAGGDVLGVVSLNGIDRKHRKSDWAFYLDEKGRGGLGAALEYAMLNHAFSNAGLEKLNCEVLETNPAVVRMHKRFGFSEEGFRRSNVEKNGQRIGVHFLGITREEWLEKRLEVSEQHQATLSKFEVDILSPRTTQPD